MSQTPSLGEVILGAIETYMDGVFTAMPGIVVSYDSVKQAADVQPAIERFVEDETGEYVKERLPVVPEVPIVFPGVGDYSITFPIAKGDPVLLVCMSDSMDRWLAQGGIIEPLDNRKHSLADAVAIPGLRSFKKPVPAAGVSSNALVIRANKICLGNASAADGVARKSDLQALVDGVDARLIVLQAQLAVLAAGLPGTAAAHALKQSELNSTQAFRDAIPSGWPTASTKVFLD